MDPIAPNEPVNVSQIFDQHPQVRANLVHTSDSMGGLRIPDFRHPPAEAVAYATLAARLYPIQSLGIVEKDSLKALNGRAFRALRIDGSNLSWKNTIVDSVQRPQAAQTILAEIDALVLQRPHTLGLRTLLVTDALACGLACGNMDVVKVLMQSMPEDSRGLFQSQLQRLGLFDEAKAIYTSAGETALIGELDAALASPQVPEYHL